jgi:hypothetical protein
LIKVEIIKPPIIRIPKRAKPLKTVMVNHAETASKSVSCLTPGVIFNLYSIYHMDKKAKMTAAPRAAPNQNKLLFQTVCLSVFSCLSYQALNISTEPRWE